VPNSLITKPTQQGANKLKAWTSGKSLNFVDDAENVLTGVNAEAKIFTKLDDAIGNQKVLGTFKAGFIYKVDNASGHFKPDASTMDLVETLFKQKFPSKSFNAELLKINQIFKKLGQ
jgi:hypothetical protein